MTLTVRNRRSGKGHDTLRATLTSKGQLTVPIEIRRLYDLKQGDELAFRVAEDAIEVTPVRRRAASSFLGALPATRRYPGETAMQRAVIAAKVRHYRKKLRLDTPTR